MSNAWLRTLYIVAFLMVVVFVCSWFLSIYRGVTKDKQWARRVHKQFQPEATRVWALNALRFYSRTGDFGMHRTWLTNAPSALGNSYDRLPYVLVEDENGKAVCLHLKYGGGVYDWGLTIGATNLPAIYARGKNHETWAPGIYFWWN